MVRRLRNVSKEQKKAFESFDLKRFIQTNFFDVPTLQRLGMLDVTSRMLTHGGLGGFIEHNAPTYPELAAEFLVTFERGDASRVRFNLLDQSHTCAHDQLRHAFGITRAPSLEWQSLASEQQRYDVWHAATVTGFDGHHGEYNYKFVHPCLRLVHKVLAMSFSGQGGVNKVHAGDLSWLWSLAPQSRGTPDWVEIFIDSCLKIRRKKRKGRIGLGGMISLIAHHILEPAQCGVPMSGGYTYTIDQLRRACLIEVPDGPGYIWKTGKNGDHRLTLLMALPYGPTNDSLYIAPDQNVVEEDIDIIYI